MSVNEIESAATKLSRDELNRFAEWFEEFQAQAWDEQIATDSAAGRLDKLINEANEQFESGQYKPL